MNDSYDKLSFREGWQPTGRSADVTLHFQKYANDFKVRTDALYYFKPVETFNVPGMSDDDKFDGIDSYIVDAFGCDPDDIITVSSHKYRGAIIMSEHTLRRAGVKLPRWPETPRHVNRAQRRLVLVPQ
jgi:hypothetical protein